MNDTTPDRCRGMLEGARVVVTYMRQKLRPKLKTLPNSSPRESLVQAIFLRSRCWMETLSRLDRPQDFQAIAACSRSLVESCVDLIFITHDVTGELTIKMHDWVKSEKFKHSRKVVKFYGEQGQPIPDEQVPLEWHYEHHKDSITAIRDKHRNGDHKSRWTGNALDVDCKAADQLEGKRIKAELGKSLMEFYSVEIGRLNWQVHGSGVAMFEDLPESEFYDICLVGLSNSSILAILISVLTIKALRLDLSTGNFDAEWDNLRAERNRVYWEQLKQQPLF